MKSKQKGFSIVEILIVVTIVGLIGAVGWLMYDRQKSDTNDSQSSTQVSKQAQKKSVKESKPENTNAQKYMAIKEWGIKLPVDNAGGELSYTLSGKYASIRSAELDELSSGCTSNSVNVARGMASEVVPNEMSSSEGSTFLEVYNDTVLDTSNLTARSIKAKVGEYYFVVPGFAGAPCIASSDGTPASKTKQAAETTATLNIVKAINNLVQQ